VQTWRIKFKEVSERMSIAEESLILTSAELENI